MGKAVRTGFAVVGLLFLLFMHYDSKAQDAIQRQAECDFMKVISASCDNIPTHAYVYNVDSSLTKMCNAVGFGIPYHSAKGSAEPSRATWVRCVDPKTKELKLVYSEAPMIISPFELNADGSYLVPEDVPQQ